MEVVQATEFEELEVLRSVAQKAREVREGSAEWGQPREPQALERAAPLAPEAAAVVGAVAPGVRLERKVI